MRGSKSQSPSYMRGIHWLRYHPFPLLLRSEEENKNKYVDPADTAIREIFTNEENEEMDEEEEYEDAKRRIVYDRGGLGLTVRRGYLT